MTDVPFAVGAEDRLESVVVGIDGSESALHAAVWAVDEAVSRDVPIRLVHVIDPDFTDDHDEAMAYAGRQLNRAWELLNTEEHRVKLESDIRQGSTAGELVDAAQEAALLCIGAKGHKHSGHGHGALAREIVALSSTPVAIVRHQHGADDLSGEPPRRWIMAVLDENHGGAVALQAAIAEAELRDAPVLAMTSWSTTWRCPDQGGDDLRVVLDHYLKSAEDDNAGLQVCALQTPPDLLRLLDDAANTLMMIVVSAGNTSAVTELTSRKATKLLRHSGCSLLTVNGPSPATK